MNPSICHARSYYTIAEFPITNHIHTSDLHHTHFDRYITIACISMPMMQNRIESFLLRLVEESSAVRVLLNMRAM